MTDNVVIKDSLDNDTSSVYITTGFPKDVHDTIYTTNEILWNYVRKGYYESSKLDSTFSFDMFRNILLQDNFSIDTSDINETYYYKNFFNRRGTIRIGDINKKEFSFTIQTLYWHDRKKYRVVELFILKKRKSNTDILTYHYIY